MLTLCLRNLALYCKDKTTVLLSFLAEFIIVGLYVLFIRDQLLESFSQLPDAGLLMDVWMIAGVLGIAAVTTTMGACGVMVEDKARKIDRDFRVSPLRPGTLLGGYWSAAVVIGLVLSFLLLLLAEVYVSHRYGVRLGGAHVRRLRHLAVGERIGGLAGVAAGLFFENRQRPGGVLHHFGLADRLSHRHLPAHGHPSRGRAISGDLLSHLPRRGAAAPDAAGAAALRQPWPPGRGGRAVI